MQPGKQTLADVRGKLGLAFQAVKNHLRKLSPNRNALEVPAIKAAIESGMADLLAAWAECSDADGRIALSAQKNTLLRFHDFLTAFHRADDELGKFSADKSKVGYSEAKSNLERAMDDLKAIWQAFVGADGRMPEGTGVKLSALPADANEPTRRMQARVFGGGAGPADPATESTGVSMDDICVKCSGLSSETVDGVLRLYGVSRDAYESHKVLWDSRAPERHAAALLALSATPAAASPGDGKNEVTRAMESRVFGQPA
jgi:hypothetical protein